MDERITLIDAVISALTTLYRVKLSSFLDD